MIRVLIQIKNYEVIKSLTTSTGYRDGIEFNDKMAFLCKRKLYANIIEQTSPIPMELALTESGQSKIIPTNWQWHPDWYDVVQFIKGNRKRKVIADIIQEPIAPKKVIKPKVVHYQRAMDLITKCGGNFYFVEKSGDKELVTCKSCLKLILKE